MALLGRYMKGVVNEIANMNGKGMQQKFPQSVIAVLIVVFVGAGVTVVWCYRQRLIPIVFHRSSI